MMKNAFKSELNGTRKHCSKYFMLQSLIIHVGFLLPMILKRVNMLVTGLCMTWWWNCLVLVSFYHSRNWRRSLTMS